MIGDLRTALEREMARSGLRGKKLSRKAGLNEQAVRDLMSKIDDPRVSTLLKLAKALGVPASFLFDDFIPIRGQVGAGGVVRFVEDADPEMVPRPPFAKAGELVAIRVVGDMLRPLHRDGDILFISRQIDALPDLEYLGDEVVAQMMDGPIYLRTLMGGRTKGKHRLRQEFGGLDSDDVILAWASPILFTTRRGGLPKKNNGGA